MSAGRGAQWVTLGWKTFAARPLAFTGLFAFFLFGAFALLLLPWIGPLLMLAVFPLLTLGFMIATRESQAGSFPAFGVFFRPFSGPGAHRAELIKLGLIYAAGGIVLMLASDLIDAGRFSQLQSLLGSTRDEDRRRIDELLADPRLQWGMLARLGLTALLSIPFWHAPALVHWGSQSALQSLFSSTLAVWTNRAALSLYVLVWTGLVLGFGLVAGSLAALLGAPWLLGVLGLPAGLTFSAAFYASLWFTYRDSFSEDDGAGQ